MTIGRRVFESVSECEALRQQWRFMLTQCRHATPFHTYEWTMANLSAFDNDAVFVLALSDHSDVVGILPLVLKKGRRYINTHRWIEFAGLPHADYGGALVRPGYELAVAEDLLEFLKTRLTEWEGVHLDRLSQQGGFVRALASAANQLGWHVSARQSDSVRRLSREHYFQSQLEEAGSRSLEKARRKLAMKGDVIFEVLHQVDEIHQQLETYIRLHTNRFASLGRQSPLASPTHIKFYEQMIAECAAAGYLWLSRLTCRGAPVAMRLSLACNDILHLYSTCFAAEFGKYSQSMLQLAMLLDYAFHHGINAADFGIGESPHKRQAGSILQPPMIRVEIYHNRWPSIESSAYDLTERACMKWPPLRRGGKMLRRMFPYGPVSRGKCSGCTEIVNPVIRVDT